MILPLSYKRLLSSVPQGTMTLDSPVFFSLRFFRQLFKYERNNPMTIPEKSDDSSISETDMETRSRIKNRTSATAVF